MRFAGCAGFDLAEKRLIQMKGVFGWKCRVEYVGWSVAGLKGSREQLCIDDKLLGFCDRQPLKSKNGIARGYAARYEALTGQRYVDNERLGWFQQLLNGGKIDRVGIVAFEKIWDGFPYFNVCICNFLFDVLQACQKRIVVVLARRVELQGSRSFDQFIGRVGKNAFAQIL